MLQNIPSCPKCTRVLWRGFREVPLCLHKHPNTPKQEMTLLKLDHFSPLLWQLLQGKKNMKLLSNFLPPMVALYENERWGWKVQGHLIHSRQLVLRSRQYLFKGCTMRIFVALNMAVLWNERWGRKVQGHHFHSCQTVLKRRQCFWKNSASWQFLVH